MKKEYQISAMVSDTTRELLEKYSKVTGIKKGHLVEEALLHHFQALETLPADVIIHPRIVVTRESFEKIIEANRSAKATPALRRLMKRGN